MSETPLPKRPKSSRVKIITGVIVALLLILFIFDGFYSPTASISKAKKTTALATETAVESSITNFYKDYGTLPKVPTEVKTNTPAGVELLTILRGMETSATLQNIRGIKFLSVREGKNGKNGLIYDPSGAFIVGLYDPWGNPYTVVLDHDYDEQLHFTYGGRTVDLRGRRVAAYSPGKDGKPGTADDILTW